LLLDKQVYLFDEVENSLDIYSQNYLKQVIQDFAKE
jgi:ABC-type transport system involved in cytochrome bd biosynthesis fused ATPase/permease subunit